MELDDCAFPLLDNVVVTDDADRAFDGVNWGSWLAQNRAVKAWSEI